jgi:phosphatidylglycerophosphatase A
VTKPTLASLLDPVQCLALGFGSGLAPRAPGTFGTLAAVPIYLLLAPLSLPLYLLVVTVLFGLGVWACDYTATRLGVHDHPAIVWDEVVGFLVTMAAAPRGAVWVLVGFLLFRLFDVIKPWPIGLLDRRVSGGFGIMLDDLVAGLLALGVLQLLRWALA